jgi:tetratricopeptide (TPR) repeat protein
MTDAALEQRAMLLQAVGEDDMTRARLEAARAQFEEADRTTAALLSAHPNDTKRIFAHSQSEYWVGYVNWQSGRFAQAEEKFNAYAALVRRLLAHDAANPGWILEMGYANDDIGMLVMRVDHDLPRAEGYLTEAVANFTEAAHARPDDTNIQAQLADAYGWVGDLARLQGKYPAATSSRQKQRVLLETLLNLDLRNATTRLSLVYNTLAFARIEAAEGDLTHALADLDRGHDAAVALSAAEPDNAEVSDEVRVFELFMARTLMMRPGSADHADPAIDGALDHCTMGRPSASSDELSTFCTILRARRLRQMHRIRESDDCLAPLLQAMRGRQRLNERWGLDFSDEIRVAQSGIQPIKETTP